MPGFDFETLRQKCKAAKNNIVINENGYQYRCVSSSQTGNNKFKLLSFTYYK
tara:strand:+ start:11457 stop:11612 length:156 start_codon:yes stop_codon:yes gene_type:complete